jgi:ethanolamine utilization protein EutA (predicted chaperonin)
MSLMATPVDSNGEIVNTEIVYKESEKSENESEEELEYESLYEQIKRQTEDAGMKVEEIEGKVVITGRPN